MNAKAMCAGLVVAVLASGILMAGPLQQDLGPDGIVSAEAENYDANVEVGGHAFEETGPVGGFTGVLGMHAPNGQGGHTSNYAANSERLEYEINFVNTGPHYVWILAWAESGSDDSCHAGLNGEETPLSDRLSGWNGGYEWNNGRYQRDEPGQIDIPSAGVHTLNIWVREDGLIIDKIILTTNPDYVPQGNGPPESSRGVRVNASALHPGLDADDVLRDSQLVWIPGVYAAQHNLYVGDNFEDVNSATVPTAAGLDVNAFDPGRFEFGQTYYWRVDEVNGTPDKTVFTGDVWSFTVEPYSIRIPGADIVATASSSSNEQSTPQTTISGDGLGADNTHTITAEDMWFSDSPDLDPWIQYEFEGVIKLDKMRVWNSNSGAESAIGWGIKDVQIEYSVDGEAWSVLADVNQFSRAPGALAYDQFDEIDFDGSAARYVRIDIESNWGGILMSYSLSEVQFYMIPAAARTPEPDSGTSDVLPSAVIAWRAGRGAAQHVVYMSTDPDEVANGSAPSVTSNTNSLALDTLDLQMGETYYWRVDEVNDAETVSVWAGPVWSLSLVNALTVDDFEGYSNLSPDRPFQSWFDGYGYSADEFFPVAYGGNGTGAAIGHDIWSLSSPYYDGDLMETGITLPGSSQSMPFYYGNSGGVASETQRPFAVPQDWTPGGAQTLSIAFRGQSDNTGTLYAKINDTKVTYSGTLDRSMWHFFNIDLSALNTNVDSITSLSIGVEGSNASGLILVDNIMLHPDAGPVDPGSTGLPLVAWVSFHDSDEIPSSTAAGAGFTEAPDKPYTDLLEANGYEVLRYVTTSEPDPDFLNHVDLVIVSRSVASSGYQDDGATAWNNITSPMIITGGYTARSSRMGFTTGTTMVDTAGDISLAVNQPNHAIFAGIELAQGTMVNPFAGVMVYPTDGTTVARGISVNNSELDDEGTLLATISTASDPAAGGMMIAEWPAGASLTHDGGAGTDTLGGPRLVFLTGSREASGITSDTSGLYDLYADGEQMFINAVQYMLSQ
ncbi:MAG: discoidin domain-containing protein [Planctomycetes bacterium]|nr:discoidin domain-containing protein [Planctomycetota bacterium]